MSKSADLIDQPDLLHTIFEIPRTGLELFRSVSKRGAGLVLGKARQDDKGIIVTVPGFMAHDLTMSPMRRALNLSGFKTYESGIGFNFGSVKNLKNLEGNIERVYEENEGEGIILDGHSLGGVLSLYIAYKHPEKIEQVHTFGSPVAAVFGLGGANKALYCLQKTINFNHEGLVAELREMMEDGPPNAAVTSFYSHEDGIVAAEAAQHPWGDSGKHTNICVEGSHCGMIINHKTFDLHVRRVSDIQAKTDTHVNECVVEPAHSI